MLLSMMDIDECSSSCMITKEKEKEKVVVVVEDMIIEILLLLPPVSVIRFKRVCKSWYSHISNPDFLWFLKHYQHHPQRLLDHHPDNDVLLISTVEGKQPYIDSIFFISKVVKEEGKQHQRYYPPPAAAEYVIQTQNQNDQDQQQQLKVFLDHALSVFIPQKFPSSSSCFPKLIDSCNGLLLYRIGNYSNNNSITGDETTRYHVFNPMTKKCFELPLLNNTSKLRKGYFLWLHIVFDPSVSTLSFKVVIHFLVRATPNTPRHSGIYVYSSATSSWKYLTYFYNRHYTFCRQFGAVLLDGFLYMYKAPYRLFCFDVANDKIWSLPLPFPGGGGSKFDDGQHMLYFGKCDGSLRMVWRYVGDNTYYGTRTYGTRLITTWPPSGFYIIELKLEFVHDNAEPQILYKVKYKCPTDDFIDHIPLTTTTTTTQIIHIYKTGKDEDEEEALLLLNIDSNTVISYNLTSKTYGKEQKKVSDVDHSHGLYAFPYTPTLFPFSC